MKMEQQTNLLAKALEEHVCFDVADLISSFFDILNIEVVNKKSNHRTLTQVLRSREPDDDEHVDLFPFQQIKKGDQITLQATKLSFSVSNNKVLYLLPYNMKYGYLCRTENVLRIGLNMRFFAIHKSKDATIHCGRVFWKFDTERTPCSLCWAYRGPLFYIGFTEYDLWPLETHAGHLPISACRYCNSLIDDEKLKRWQYGTRFRG